MKVGEAHLWRIGLQRNATELEGLCDLLSPDELERAQRFHFAKDRMRFIAARGEMRSILSQYTQVAARYLCFEYSEFGKPRLSANCASDGLYFNLSHSRDRALLAICRGAEIGVDLEWIDAGIDWEAISGVSFSPEEIDALRAEPQLSRAGLFFEIWTRKEAYLKALGCGLSAPTSAFTVWPEEKLDYPLRIYPLPPREGFAGAVSCEVELSGITEFEAEKNR